jgi:hypothetical protein
MAHRIEKSLSSSLLTQYSSSRNPGAKEEALALLSFQKTKLEQVNKRYKFSYYFLVMLSTIMFLYNLAFTIVWVRLHLIICNGENNNNKCSDMDLIIDGFIIIHALALINLFLSIFAAKKERRKVFLVLQLFIVAQLIGRIVAFSQYFELSQSVHECPLLECPISGEGIMKTLLAIECAGDAILLIVCSHLIWLIYKIKSKQKLFSLVGNTRSFTEL